MRLDRKMHFLTLVLAWLCVLNTVRSTFCLAAPVSELNNPLIPVRPQDDDEYLSRIRNKKIMSDWTLGLNKINGVVNKDKANEDTWGLHLNYSKYQYADESEVANSLQLQVISIGLLSLSGSKRWIYHEVSPRDPALIGGVKAIYDAKDQLGNVIDYQRYYAFAGLGLQNIFLDRRHSQFEITAAYGTLGTHFDIKFTYLIANQYY